MLLPYGSSPLVVLTVSEALRVPSFYFFLGLSTVYGCVRWVGGFVAGVCWGGVLFCYSFLGSVVVDVLRLVGALVAGYWYVCAFRDGED